MGEKEARQLLAAWPEGAHSEGIPAEGFIITTKDDKHIRERQGIPREGTGSPSQSLLTAGASFSARDRLSGRAPLSLTATGQGE